MEEKYFITCGCANCGDRMKYTNYEPGPTNIAGYEEGWTCDKCGFDTVSAPDAPMSHARFYCNSGGCNTDLCVLCGRRKLPVFELHVGMGERTFPVDFNTPILSVSIDKAEETLTGAGAQYIVEIADQIGKHWALAVRYSEFERLHLSLEEGTWSEENPADPPFPPKEVFPNVQRRRERLDKYIKVLVERMQNLPEQYQAKLVEFFRATYYPCQPNTKSPVQAFQIAAAPAVGQKDEGDSAPVVKHVPQAARETPSKIQELKCPQNCGSIMAHTEYMPGDHNASGYRSGWECDACQFISVYEPNSQKARFRYHCQKCLLDYCITCGNKQIQNPIDESDVQYAQDSSPAVGMGSPLRPTEHRQAISPPQGRRQSSAQYSPALSRPPGMDRMDSASTTTTNSPSVNRLREAKLLLDEGLIHQQDYDDLKRKVLDELIPSTNSAQKLL